ncbi:MAG: type II toxin-antitoxin system HicA family toxin [Bacteroidales bacterium]|nr:type II toxin-antitoxin system HicA family toxin [Bacteroidales bacterium]
MARKVFELIALLEANGWVYQRTRGDHHIFSKAGARRPIPVPGKRNDDIAPGTWNAILREADIK